MRPLKCGRVVVALLPHGGNVFVQRLWGHPVLVPRVVGSTQWAHLAHSFEHRLWFWCTQSPLLHVVLQPGLLGRWHLPCCAYSSGRKESACTGQRCRAATGSCPLCLSRRAGPVRTALPSGLPACWPGVVSPVRRCIRRRWLDAGRPAGRLPHIRRNIRLPGGIYRTVSARLGPIRPLSSVCSLFRGLRSPRGSILWPGRSGVPPPIVWHCRLGPMVRVPPRRCMRVPSHLD